MRKIILISVIQQLLYHISRVESLIGQNVIRIRRGEFPFIATFQLFPEEHNFCGGALITKKQVLTLARCLEGIHVHSFRIVFDIPRVQGHVVTYSAASWMTYKTWARTQGISVNAHNRRDMAIVTLTDKVYHVNPVALSGLTKSQLNGTKAKMIGWKYGVLSKATVQLLSDEDCKRSLQELSIDIDVSDGTMLFSAANPFALLSPGDKGSPLLDARDNSLLGLASGFCPDHEYRHENLTIEYIRQHQVNTHSSVDYYRSFIYSFIPAVPAA